MVQNKDSVKQMIEPQKYNSKLGVTILNTFTTLTKCLCFCGLFYSNVSITDNVVLRLVLNCTSLIVT